MKIEVDSVEILDIDATSLVALNWRLVDLSEWIKGAIVGQISHAKGEMVKMETNRVKGSEVGMPADFQEDSLVTWLATQPGYQTAAERQPEE